MPWDHRSRGTPADW